MPALSPTMTQGNIAEWKLEVGGKINAGDVIADIETDKATMALESMEVGARGFHSSAFRLNLSRFLH